jgi:hypothetical protein
MTTISSQPLPRRFRIHFRWWKRAYSIALVSLLALALRLWAAWQLPLDADEPVYLRAASDYADLIANRDWGGVVDYAGNSEHPPLVKLLYSIPFQLFDPPFGESPELIFNRIISAFFGTLAVFLLSLMDPLAGLFLAFHSLVIKYTSEVYLEALPLAAVIGSVLSLERSQKGIWRWYWISAVLLGIAVAGKMTYGMIVVVMAYFWISQRPVSWKRLCLYGVVALISFWAANPSLWHDPLGRLQQMISYHAGYTQSIDVLRADYPWYQPMLWIITTVPWHPNVFFFLTSDDIVFWVSIAGLGLAFKRRPWSAVWLVSILVLLLFWPTKWPQYTIILIPAMCLIAADAIRWFVNWAQKKDSYWDYLSEMLPRPPKLFWILLFGLVGVLLTGKIVYEIQKAVLRQGWVQMSSVGTPLPSDRIFDIQTTLDGRVALATANGAAIWTPNEEAPWGQSGEWYVPANSGIIGENVLAILQDNQGEWWFGTDQGLSHFDGKIWTSYSALDMNLDNSQVNALAEDSMGQIWVGTLAGASVWNGQIWIPYTAPSAGLVDDVIYAIEIHPTPTGDLIWFGGALGVSRLDWSNQSWQSFDFHDLGLGWAGVADLYLDTGGMLWAGTMGGGLACWDGTGWIFYRTSNSDIPYNYVQAIIETTPGVYWLGVGLPTEPGGVLVRFDGVNWTRYNEFNSGFTGSEPYALAKDDQGRLWIGTATNGLQIYTIQSEEK